MAQQIRAKHNYAPSRPDELAFKKKEVFVGVAAADVLGPCRPLTGPAQVLTLVTKVASKGWWIARNAANKEGLVPFNYFEVRR